jgi:hypothetical protein
MQAANCTDRPLEPSGSFRGVVSTEGQLPIVTGTHIRSWPTKARAAISMSAIWPSGSQQRGQVLLEGV